MVPPRDSAVAVEQRVDSSWDTRVDLDDGSELSEEELARYEQDDDLTPEEHAELARRIEEVNKGHYITLEEFFAEVGIKRK